MNSIDKFLSPSLNMVVSLVPVSETVCDIGTDHAYVAIKLINANDPEWYLRSEELLILSHQIDLALFIICTVLSLVFHKKTIISLLLQILPITCYVLYYTIYKALVS